jgi:hypothetical protein
MAEIRSILYSKELQKQIFPDNSFYKKSVTETGVADTTDTVEKPVQNKISKAKEGAPKKLPLEIETSTDTKKTYPVVLFYCQPLLVDSQSELLVNYNKRQTKQEQQAGEINVKVANYAAYRWAPSKSDNILKTSGDARASNIVGFTSQRKRVTKDDLLKIYNLMLRMNVSGLPGKWYGMLTPDAYTDLLVIPEFVDYQKTGNTSKLEHGIIGQILGIELFSRTTDDGHIGVLYKANGTPISGDSDVTDALYAGNLFWNDKMVCRAEGRLRTVVNTNAPGYLGGTILECFTRFGADIIRDDQKGVIALLEDKA